MLGQDPLLIDIHSPLRPQVVTHFAASMAIAPRATLIRAVAPFVGWHLCPEWRFDAEPLREALLTLSGADALCDEYLERFMSSHATVDAIRHSQASAVRAACAVFTSGRDARDSVSHLVTALAECYGASVEAVETWLLSCWSVRPGTSPALSIRYVVYERMRAAVRKDLEEHRMVYTDPRVTLETQWLDPWAWCPEQDAEWRELINTVTEEFMSGRDV